MSAWPSNFTLSMRNYNENNACNYVYMNICKPPITIWKQLKKRVFKVPNIKKKKIGSDAWGYDW